ncbi:hypothetical protein [Kribbella sp. CA-293567]|uniref:hypothetical protein n=1 Tax=Kribbella sp. CA-293567 TaxID=3002436 RepID=UPI0022DD9C53|nr:hypothetical protein [Kribbella sp. CA-293567]WBQ04021.1 hypothetical protein OX958_29145 [Kribbella sp. CA-293567]
MKRVALASFAVGAVLAAFFAVLLVRNLPSTPQPIGAGSVQLKKDGLQLWASVRAAEPACEVKNSAGSEVALTVATGSERITINDKSWYLVARSTDVVPAGDYTVSCVAADPGTTYAVGPRLSIGTFVLSILGLVFSLLIFIGLGVVLLVISSVRKRKNQPGGTFPSGGPGYPRQGNTFPGYPPPGGYNPGPNPDRPQDR